MALRLRHMNNALQYTGELVPIDLNMGFTLSGINWINYKIPESSRLFRESLTAPYVSNFFLTDGGFELMSGIHTSIRIVEDEEHNIFLEVAGKSWLHYFERIIWPKDPNSTYRTTTAADPTNGTVFDYTNIAGYLFYKLGTESTTLANSLPVTIPNYGGGPGSSYRYQIYPGDTETIYSKMLEILKFSSVPQAPRSEINTFQPNPIYITLWPYGPSVSPTIKLVHGENCRVIDYADDGILGTRTFGIQQLPSSRKGLYVDSANQSTYRRWDVVEEFTSNQDSNLSALTTQVAADHSAAHLQITVEYFDSDKRGANVDLNLLFMANAKCGITVSLKADLGYKVVNGNFLLSGIEYTTDDEGNTKTILTLDTLSAVL